MVSRWEPPPEAVRCRGAKPGARHETGGLEKAHIPLQSLFLPLQRRFSERKKKRHSYLCFDAKSLNAGIGKSKDGRYYLIHGTQWQGERDSAEIVSEEEAKATVLKNNPDIYEEMFEEPIPEL